jgi:nucleoside-diphosphate-sugar epimerase
VESADSFAKDPAFAPMTATPVAAARVIVLGASGFIGRWTARTLGQKGASVWCAVRDAPSAGRIVKEYEIKGAVCRVDVTAAKDLEHLLREVRPHTVFNLSGYGVDQRERDPALAHAINEEVLRCLVDLVSRYADPVWPGLALVHTGSALEYGAVGGNLDEDTIPNPTTDYGRSKLAGTLTVERAHRNGLRAVTARLFTVYGAGEHPGRLLPTLLDAATRGDRVALSRGAQQRDFTYVEDVADGLARLALVKQPAPAVMNLATGTLCSVRDFVERVSRLLGIDDARLGFGDVPPRPDEMQHTAVSVGRLRTALEWVPETTIEDGVRATVRFLEEHPAG